MDQIQARAVIRGENDTGDILRRLEAIETAIDILGDDCTMSDIWKWVEEKED